MRIAYLVPLLFIISSITPNGCSDESNTNADAPVENIGDVLAEDIEPVITEETALVWVKLSIDPVQCYENPWEEEYLKKNNNDYEGLKAREMEVIKTYYSAQGIAVKNVTSEKTHEFVCDACDCPRGDTIFLEVAEAQKDQLLGLGFRQPGTQENKE